MRTRIALCFLLLASLAATASDVLTATVKPTINGTMVDFSVTATSSTNSPINSWGWNFGTTPYSGCIGRPSPDPSFATCPLNISHTYAKAGNYTAYLLITDLANGNVSISVSFTVLPNSLTVSLSLLPQLLNEPRTPRAFAYTISSTGSVIKTIINDCGNQLVNPVVTQNLFTYNPIDTNLVITGITSTTSAFHCSYPASGTYVVTLTAIDYVGTITKKTIQAIIP